MYIHHWGFLRPSVLVPASVSNHLNHSYASLWWRAGRNPQLLGQPLGLLLGIWLVCSFFSFPGIFTQGWESQGTLQGSICLTGIGCRVAPSRCSFHCGHCTPGWCCPCTQDGGCASREHVQIPILGKLLSGLVQCGDIRIKVLCVETNACLKKKSNLVVFDASAAACCKAKLCTGLAPVGSLPLASL